MIMYHFSWITSITVLDSVSLCLSVLCAPSVSVRLCLSICVCPSVPSCFLHLLFLSVNTVFSIYVCLYCLLRLCLFICPYCVSLSVRTVWSVCVCPSVYNVFFKCVCPYCVLRVWVCLHCLLYLAELCALPVSVWLSERGLFGMD